MFSRYKFFALLPLLTAGMAYSAAISVNGTCEVGNCADPSSLFPGQSIGTTHFNFIYTLPDTDQFDISGTYSANGNAPSISFYATAVYLGNSSDRGSHADTLSVNLLQSFGYNDDPDGTYSETATLSQSNVASGSYVTADLSFDGESIGVLGPFYGIGSKTYSKSAYLSGLCNPSPADFNYTFHVAECSPAVPEPANAALAGIGIAILGGIILRRKATSSL